MNKKLLGMAGVTLGVLLGVAGALVGIFWNRLDAEPIPESLTQGVVIQQDGHAGLQDKLAKRITSAPEKRMTASGLAGAMGKVHLKVASNDPQAILLPMPQLADGQVPLCYFLSATPADAVTEIRMGKRDDENVAVLARLAGKKQDVQIAWSSVVLLAPKMVTPNRTNPNPYREATGCVQSRTEEITKLAGETWPASGKTGDFAANIQRHIQGSKRTAQPRSLDAVGIVKSGENSICTANSNLAAALLRSKGIACRTVAVIPVIPGRFEMHRIAEFAEGDNWVSFDPSSVQIDIPTKPWQYVIMGKTTTQDEERAMKPRMACMVGTPYGQEVELLTPGVYLSGQDFFWTAAKPLAEFEPTEEASRLSAEGWIHYLETGKLTPGQLEASSARTAAELVEHLSKK